MITRDRLPPAPAEAVSEFCAPQDRRAAGLAGAFAMWQRFCLRYKIRSSEQYLAMCEREGITAGRSISEWKRQLADQRAQLRRLEGGAA